MGTYVQQVSVPGINIIPDTKNHVVTICAKKGTWAFQKDHVISFAGLDITFMIQDVYPNGVTLINSDNSVPKFFTWAKLFNGDTIFRDCADRTGWMTVK